MSGSGLEYLVQPTRRFEGAADIPGDKSISHRAVMLSAIAEGRTRVEGFLPGADTLSTMAILQALGVRIERPTPTTLLIDGVGLHGLREPVVDLDCGNAGTAMRLLAGLLAGQRFPTCLIGDESLSRRPMRRVIEPLSAMGARIEASATGTAPLHIHPVTSLRGIEYRCPVASAQVKSSVLLAGLYAEGESVVTEPAATRDYTESMLRALGADVRVQGFSVSLRPGAALRAMDIVVPGDFSSAAFLLVAGAIAEAGEVRVANVGLNPRRTGLLSTLVDMGANIELIDRRMVAGEEVGDLRVRPSALRAIEVPIERVPDMIDEFPIFAIAAACAEGVSVVRGAHELRVKESDRIAAVVAGLRAIGVGVEEYPDGLAIEGRPGWTGACVDSRGDHRIAMSFTVAALRASAPIAILDCANVATSFPGFVALMRSLGMDLSERRGEA